MQYFEGSALNETDLQVIKNTASPCVSAAMPPKTDAFACGAAAFVAKTLPLPWASTAFVAKTLPLLAVPQRAKVDQAVACFIMSARITDDEMMEDAGTVLRVSAP